MQNAPFYCRRHYPQLINWCCVCIAAWNWAQSGKKLIVTFMVHAMCIQCRVWTLPWSLMHSVVTPKRFGQRLCRGRVSMSHWLEKKRKKRRLCSGDMDSDSCLHLPNLSACLSICHLPLSAFLSVSLSSRFLLKAWQYVPEVKTATTDFFIMPLSAE